MSPEVGFHDYKGTGECWEGLASEDFQVISITVKGSTRDTGNINTDDIRAGMCLQLDTTEGKYELFSSDHDSLVILAEPLYDLSDNGDQVARAFIRGTFKKDSVIEPISVTWSSAQRFIFRQDY